MMLAIVASLLLSASWAIGRWFAWQRLQIRLICYNEFLRVNQRQAVSLVRLPAALGRRGCTP
jgi:hypothetical protein